MRNIAQCFMGLHTGRRRLSLRTMLRDVWTIVSHRKRLPLFADPSPPVATLSDFQQRNHRLLTAEDVSVMRIWYDHRAVVVKTPWGDYAELPDGGWLPLDWDQDRVYAIEPAKEAA